MKIRFLFLFLFVLALLATGCRKNDYKPKKTPENQLPPATQEGKNTFGCLVNGKLWLPYKPNPFIFFPQPKPLTINYVPEWDYFSFNAKGVNSENLSFKKYLSGATQVIDNTDTAGFNFSITRPELHAYFYTDSINTGLLTITKRDTINKIIAGTFYFNAREKNSGEVIKITDGRFDFSYE